MTDDTPAPVAQSPVHRPCPMCWSPNQKGSPTTHEASGLDVESLAAAMLECGWEVEAVEDVYAIAAVYRRLTRG